MIGKPRRRPALSLDLLTGDIGPALHVPADQFLGRFTRDDLRAELESAGILPHLRALGYAEAEMRFECEDLEHRLFLVDPASDVVLVDLRMADASWTHDIEALRAAGLSVLSVMAVHWLSLQHPRGSFTRERPRLPGQKHPGLGLGKSLYLRVAQWARAWGRDALLNVPEYLHNAAIYSAIFRFADPERQGWFEALTRDLAHVPVAVASAAVEEGQVIDAAGEVVAWEPGEMMAAVSEPVRAYLASPAYAEIARDAREKARFRIAA